MHGFQIKVPEEIKSLMSVFTSFDNVPDCFDIVLYDKSEDVLAKYFSTAMDEDELDEEDDVELDGESFLALPDGSISGMDEYGNEEPLCTEKMNDVAQEQGFWGFTDSRVGNVLHVWVNVDRLIHRQSVFQIFLGHEIGTLYDDFIQDLHSDVIKKLIADEIVQEEVFGECRADCYGLTSYLSFEIANFILSQRDAAIVPTVVATPSTLQ